MSIASMFGWKIQADNEELPDIFPLSISQEEFVKIDVVNIYSKILTDVAERTHGLPKETSQLLWDNCVMSESSDGLITMLAKAMTNKDELFLVYEKALKLLRKANNQEAAQIKADYEKKGQSSIGVFISFKNYVRSDMVKVYSALEHCTVSALNKTMNLSKAIQLKLNDLRGGVGLTDSSVAKTQAVAMANGLKNGKDIMLDAKDIVETAKPDLTAIKDSIMFLNQKRSFYLGLPASYINGEIATRLGDTGEADTKATERGLKNYFESVMKPVLVSVFGSKVTYKSQDFGQIESAMDVLKTFSLTDETLVSQENKQLIINRLFDLPEDAKGDPAPEVDPNAPVIPGTKTPAPVPGKDAPPKGNA